MPSSLLTLAKRAFIRVLLAFAAQYAVGVTVNRDSTDAEIVKAYRRVVRKVHPDKGGRDEDAGPRVNGNIANCPKLVGPIPPCWAQCDDKVSPLIAAAKFSGSESLPLISPLNLVAANRCR